MKTSAQQEVSLKKKNLSLLFETKVNFDHSQFGYMPVCQFVTITL